GEIVRLPYRSLAPHDARGFLEEILTPAQRETLDRTQSIDFLYEVPGVARFRANVYVQSNGLGAVFRVIPQDVPTADAVGVPATVQQLASHANGLVLITGPTGSGKSTTVAALIDRVNRTQARHILTIEDPVEYLHENHRSVLTQREVGRDAISFAAALR